MRIIINSWENVKFWYLKLNDALQKSVWLVFLTIKWRFSFNYQHLSPLLYILEEFENAKALIPLDYFWPSKDPNLESPLLTKRTITSPNTSGNTSVRLQNGFLSNILISKKCGGHLGSLIRWIWKPRENSGGLGPWASTNFEPCMGTWCSLPPPCSPIPGPCLGRCKGV